MNCIHRLEHVEAAKTAIERSEIGVINQHFKLVFNVHPSSQRRLSQKFLSGRDGLEWIVSDVPRPENINVISALMLPRGSWVLTHWVSHSRGSAGLGNRRSSRRKMRGNADEQAGIFDLDLWYVKSCGSPALDTTNSRSQQAERGPVCWVTADKLSIGS